MHRTGTPQAAMLRSEVCLGRRYEVRDVIMRMRDRGLALGLRS